MQISRTHIDQASLESQQIVGCLDCTCHINSIRNENGIVPECSTDRSGLFRVLNLGLILRIAHVHQVSGVAMSKSE